VRLQPRRKVIDAGHQGFTVALFELPLHHSQPRADRVVLTFVPAVGAIAPGPHHALFVLEVIQGVGDQFARFGLDRI
jgi:hypothetical protein